MAARSRYRPVVVDVGAIEWRSFFAGLALGAGLMAIVAFTDCVVLVIRIAYRGFRR